MRRSRVNQLGAVLLAAGGAVALAAPALAGPELAAAGLLAAHHVADYDTWKKAFDAHAQARVDAGCLGHEVYRDADDPGLIHVWLPGTSAERLQEFAASPDLRESMERAGVQGPPSITFVRPRLVDVDPAAGSAGMIASHAVQDYESWRAAYDALDEHRRGVGITGHAVYQVVGEPDRVVVYHQAESLETLREFVASATLAEAMQKAGVVGPPDIRFVQAVDRAEYPVRSQ